MTTKGKKSNSNLKKKAQVKGKSRSKKESNKEILNGLVLGQVTKGDVVAIKDFGVFVRLNYKHKVDALLHKSQISNKYIGNLADHFSVGQTVEARITRVDYDKGEVAISTRPQREERFSISEFRDMVGDNIEGKVKRIVSYGAFIDIGCKKVDALLHVSRISDKKVENIEDYVKVGDFIDARLHHVDVDKGIIQLSMRSIESDRYHDKKRAMKERWTKIAEDVASL